ncbi:uncharacterized protein [Dermacentor albipictus]
MWCYGQLGRTRRTLFCLAPSWRQQRVESMPATCHQLKLQVWWILSDRRESHDRYLDEYRVFFSEQALLLDVDATFSFSEVYHEPSRNFYEEPIYQLDCTIEWPGITWFGPSAKHLQANNRELEREVAVLKKERDDLSAMLSSQQNTKSALHRRLPASAEDCAARDAMDVPGSRGAAPPSAPARGSVPWRSTP